MQQTRYLHLLPWMENILSQPVRIPVYIYGITLIRNNLLLLDQKTQGLMSISLPMHLLQYLGVE
jgi:hypothetical protein